MLIKNYLRTSVYTVVEYGGQWWPQYSEVTIWYSPMTKRYEFNTPARIGRDEADIGNTFIIRAILVDSPTSALSKLV